MADPLSPTALFGSVLLYEILVFQGLLRLVGSR